MPRSWGNERTVASVLSQAGYYPTDPNQTREQLQAQYIEEEQVDIGGQTYTLSRLSMYDAKLFADQLDNVNRYLNPFIWDIYAANAVACLAALRLANVQTKQGFRGQFASGNELDFTTMIAREFYDPDSSGNTRTSWDRTIATVGEKNFIEGTSSGAALTVNEYSAHIYLAFYNPAENPCLDSIQIVLNTNNYDLHTVDFEQVNVEQDDVIIPMKSPLIVPYLQSYEILAYYYRTGTDRTRPIGLTFKQSKELRSEADVRLE
jgi:hypothetical protein